MQRVLVMVAAIVLSLSFSNYSNLVEAESSTEDCWVIVKENYEWIHDDEQMVASHSSESNLTYDSQCRLVEKTVQTIDSLHHYFTSYNEDDTISNTTTYTWGYGFEQSASETDTSDTEEDSPFDICLILVVIALIIGSVYFISNRIAAASVKTLAEMVGNKLVGDMFEEE